MGVSRRAAVSAALGVATVAGCSRYGEPSQSQQASPAADVPDEGGGVELAKTSAVPVGGGVVVKARKVVVTQPEKGTFKAYSAICTHQGCTVAEVRDSVISCPCHGSEFRVTDGSVAGGPAPSALPARKIEVEGDSIRLA